MQANRETLSYTNRQVFSGPDGQGMFNKTILDPKYVGDTSREINIQQTTDVSHIFRDAPINPHPQGNNARVGGIGWGVTQHNDRRLLKSGNQIRSTGFRGEVIRKVESYPKPI